MFYKARLKTGGRTVEMVREKAIEKKWVGSFTDEHAKDLIRFYDLLDNVSVIVGDSYMNDGSFILISWDEEADEKVREAYYIAEQDPYFGTYINDRERFYKDWETGEYQNDASTSFDMDEVEIILKLDTENWIQGDKQ